MRTEIKIVALAVCISAVLTSLGAWLGVRIATSAAHPWAHPDPPSCHDDCPFIEAYALQRPGGRPLPHDCKFFADCGCAFQCPAAEAAGAAKGP